MNKAVLSVLAFSLLLTPVWAEETLPEQPQATVETLAPTTPTETTQAPVVGSAAPIVTTAPAATQTILEFSQTARDYNKKYQAVQYSLKNTQNAHLQIITGEVLNGVDEAFIAEQEAKAKANKKRAGGFLLRSLSAVPFASMGAYSSVGAYRAASIGSSVAHAAAQGLDESANAQTASYEGRYIRKFTDVVISPNEAFTFNTLGRVNS